MTKTKEDLETNPVQLAVSDIGGLARFAKLMGMYGLPVHRQTVHNWAKSGAIPHAYKRAIEQAATAYSHVFQNVSGLVKSIQPEGGLRGAVIFQNEPLEAWIKEQGGISAFVRKANAKIRSHNDQPSTERKAKLWSYVMVHNWLKRGRVSDNYRLMLKHNFDCPEEIMGPELKKPAAELNRAAQLLGDDE